MMMVYSLQWIVLCEKSRNKCIGFHLCGLAIKYDREILLDGDGWDGDPIPAVLHKPQESCPPPNCPRSLSYNKLILK